MTVKECPNCCHDITRHNEEGCQACDCHMSPDSIDYRVKELAEENKMVKRQAWSVTVTRGSGMLYIGEIKITFLHEPTGNEVLEAFLDGEDPSKFPVDLLAKVKQGRYHISETHIWEKAR